MMRKGSKIFLGFFLAVFVAMPMVLTDPTSVNAQSYRAHKRRQAHRKAVHNTRQVNRARATAVVRRTNGVLRRAWAVVKASQKGKALLARAVRHQRIARRILRHGGNYHKAAMHSLRARQLARLSMKKNRKRIEPMDNETADESELIQDENLEKLDGEADKESDADKEDIEHLEKELNDLFGS